MSRRTSKGERDDHRHRPKDQPLRVYRDHSDKTGTVMCERHRIHFFTVVPSSFGCGEYGGECALCKTN